MLDKLVDLVEDQKVCSVRDSLFEPATRPFKCGSPTRVTVAIPLIPPIEPCTNLTVTQYLGNEQIYGDGLYDVQELDGPLDGVAIQFVVNVLTGAPVTCPETWTSKSRDILRSLGWIV